MKRKRNIILLTASLISFAIVSACLFAMFFIEITPNSGPQLLSMICGLTFWGATLTGIYLQILISFDIRHWCKRKRVFQSRFKKTRIGLISVFSNIPAIISDVVLIVSLIAFIAFMIIDSTSIIAYLSLSVLFLSFSAHCVFNGKNYYYIANHEQIMSQLMKPEEK